MHNQAIDDVLDRNGPAAAMWGAGGKAYDEVSFAISDALAHTAQRLGPKPGDAVLDVATGTGWSARNAARMGARVAAIDISADLIRAARDLSAHLDPPIEFRVADAEAIPFADGRFDGVISTFGVMFAGDHRRAANELARVCRPGGRLCLATWPPDGAVAKFFAVMAAHGNAPPPAASPLLWGDPEYLKMLLGDAFALTFERASANAYHDSVDAIWDWYVRGFGPLRSLHDSLDEEGRRALKRDVDAYHEHYRVEAGLKVTREYLVTIGVRR